MLKHMCVIMTKIKNLENGLAEDKIGCDNIESGKILEIEGDRIIVKCGEMVLN